MTININEQFHKGKQHIYHDNLRGLRFVCRQEIGSSSNIYICLKLLVTIVNLKKQQQFVSTQKSC